MLWWSLLMGAHAAETCETRFEFAGQPECVGIVYDSGVSQVTNRCEQPLLLDQSVLRKFRLVGIGETVTIADLSAFTLGVDGALFRAVAQPIEVCQPDVVPDVGSPAAASTEGTEDTGPRRGA